MNPAQIRKYRRSNRQGSGSLLRGNPAILLGFSLPFVIATSISLKAAAAMSMEFLLISLFSALTAAATVNLMAMWKRAVVAVGVSTIAMMLARSLINLLFPEVYNNLGTYLYLMALGCIVILQAEQPGPQRRLAVNLLEGGKTAVRHSLLFTGLMFVMALPRELFGSGALWGRPIPMTFKLPGMLLPFFGFISMGFFLALVKFLSKKMDQYKTLESARRDARDRARYTEIRVEEHWREEEPE